MYTEGSQDKVKLLDSSGAILKYIGTPHGYDDDPADPGELLRLVVEMLASYDFEIHVPIAYQYAVILSG